MPTSFHKRKHPEPSRRFRKETVFIRGDVPRAYVSQDWMPQRWWVQRVQIHYYSYVLGQEKQEGEMH